MSAKVQKPESESDPCCCLFYSIMQFIFFSLFEGMAIGFALSETIKFPLDAAPSDFIHQQSEDSSHGIFKKILFNIFYTDRFR